MEQPPDALENINMANPGSSSGDVFDVRKIRRLVELMKEYDLREVDLQQGEQRIQLMRGAQPGDVTVAAPMAAPVAAAPAVSTPASAPPPTAEPADDHFDYVLSPMVGTFYTSSNPDSPPFVNVGDQVGPDTTVCIVEAMKVFNEIPAEVSGKIVEVLVKNGDPVDVNRKLFKVSAE
ncbi:MAG: acetyl-CoA carboxylase biotin carboxyl carrier protein [Pirellulales bacterium]|nr:acetyl-CoA carboxylase biotin carboxyl carrier protein [Pirellulales bacterium]